MSDIKFGVTVGLIDKLTAPLTKMGGAIASLGATAMKWAKRGLMVLSGAMTKLAINAVKVSAKFEQWEIAFGSMLGSATKAKVVLKDLAKFARETPFQLKDVITNSKLLLGMGFAAEDLTGVMQRLGDVAAGLGVPLERIALNFGQVMAQSKLTGRELRDFAIAGVPLLQTLAKQFKVTTGEIRDMVERGDISFYDVDQAFRTMTSSGGKFFNLMHNQMGTLNGIISNLKDSFTLISKALGDIVLPTIKKFAQNLLDVVNDPKFIPAMVKGIEVMWVDIKRDSKIGALIVEDIIKAPFSWDTYKVTAEGFIKGAQDTWKKFTNISVVKKAKDMTALAAMKVEGDLLISEAQELEDSLWGITDKGEADRIDRKVMALRKEAVLLDAKAASLMDRMIKEAALEEDNNKAQLETVYSQEAQIVSIKNEAYLQKVAINKKHSAAEKQAKADDISTLKTFLEETLRMEKAASEVKEKKGKGGADKKEKEDKRTPVEKIQDEGVADAKKRSKDLFAIFHTRFTEEGRLNEARVQLQKDYVAAVEDVTLDELNVFAARAKVILAGEEALKSERLKIQKKAEPSIKKAMLDLVENATDSYDEVKDIEKDAAKSRADVEKEHARAYQDLQDEFNNQTFDNLRDRLEAEKELKDEMADLDKERERSLADIAEKEAERKADAQFDLAKSIKKAAKEAAIGYLQVEQQAVIGSTAAGVAKALAAKNPIAAAAIAAQGVASIAAIQGAIGLVQGLEKGGITTGEQITRIGEKNKPEAVIPLTDGRAVEMLQSALGGSGNQTINVQFNLDGQPLRTFTEKITNIQSQGKSQGRF